MNARDRWLCLAHRWLEKAEGDLEAASALLDAGRGPGWIIGFHLQQAVEEALKGLLVLGGREPPRSHDLRALAESLASLGRPELAPPVTLAEVAPLQTFAVDDRYPGLSAPDVSHERVRMHEQLAARAVHAFAEAIDLAHTQGWEPAP